MRLLYDFVTPQLEKIHSGKVRESFRLAGGRRLIVTTDRISCFDGVLETAIPFKGEVLNGISEYWFSITRDIIENHFIESAGPRAMIVKEAAPVKVEMVVRGYLAGSMLKGYQKGKREFSGIKLPDGMRAHQRFETPLVTPTTKEVSDRETSGEEIISSGIATESEYEIMKRAALEIFKRGAEILAKKGVILVDSKYEFGILDGRVILIDEIHTPDSSRFWLAEEYEADPSSVDPLDKEFVRKWLAGQPAGAKKLPEEIACQTAERYRRIYKITTGMDLPPSHDSDPGRGLRENLVEAGIIKDGYVVIVMGSESDIKWGGKIAEELQKYGIFVQIRIFSAHRNAELISDFVREYNSAGEPGAVIAVAGLSNALGGALAFNLNIPVFNCPPFNDWNELNVNINSSLMLPAMSPAATVIKPENAALAALRSLNLERLKRGFDREISQKKDETVESDRKIRRRQI
jgi:phosphoribosylaminoimidazole-succinocarboxamide synthase